MSRDSLAVVCHKLKKVLLVEYLWWKYPILTEFIILKFPFLSGPSNCYQFSFHLSSIHYESHFVPDNQFQNPSMLVATWILFHSSRSLNWVFLLHSSFYLFLLFDNFVSHSHNKRQSWLFLWGSYLLLNLDVFPLFIHFRLFIQSIKSSLSYKRRWSSFFISLA